MASVNFGSDTELNSDATVNVLQAGEALSEGDWVYLSATDSKLYELIPDTTSRTVYGFVLNDVTTGGWVPVARAGTITSTFSPALVTGTVLFLDDAATNDMCTATTDIANGDYIYILGYAVDATNLKINLISTGLTAET